MRVTYKDYMGRTKEGDLDDVLAGALQRTDYDTRGVAECAQEVANRNAAAIGKLVAALVEADRLTLEQAEAICDISGDLSVVPSRSFIGS